MSQPEQERETDRDREFKPTRLKNHTNDSIDCQLRTWTEKNVRTIEMEKEMKKKLRENSTYLKTIIIIENERKK